MELHLKLQYLCSVCGQTYEAQKEFLEHILTHSSEATSIECGSCRVAFENRELLAMHVQLVHEREQPFDKHDPIPPMLRNGTMLSPNAQKEIRILHCSVCDEKCYGEDALDEHRLFSHCKVPRSDTCASCQAPLRTAEDFEKHTRMHTSDLHMHCAVCRQSIRSETQLALHCQFHMERRSDAEDIEQICGICGKVLVNRYQLDVHLMEHDERRCCPHCLRPFALAQQLLTHVADEHREDQPLHSCDICEESFRFAIQLENHALIHANETKTG
ncbi:zinc finger, C2H2 type [Oesophagostomum dentatum]|uniref:Zinc finger, C2H2 type n=1 Tax=Oesophagostomum dentatum TaxID=61180 RepID=A0A0B1T1T3_OESDE|nr:zinc finger, C2H2 type [Oesophagostomum dentatum]